MMIPMTAPTIAPEADTAATRAPAHATTTLVNTAAGSAGRTSGKPPVTDSGVTSVAPHSTAAAVAPTVRLSSRRIGRVSTNAAVMAAASGASMMNVADGGGAEDSRDHHARTTA